MLAMQTVLDEVWRACEASAASSDTPTFLQHMAEKLPEFCGPNEHQNYWALFGQCLLDRSCRCTRPTRSCTSPMTREDGEVLSANEEGADYVVGLRYPPRAPGNTQRAPIRSTSRTR